VEAAQHLQVLRALRDQLSELAKHSKSMGEKEFGPFAHAINRASNECPGMVRAIDPATVSAGVLDGYSFYSVRATLAHFVAAVAELEAAIEEPTAEKASPKPHGFISHAAEDRPLAEWIREHLLKSGVPYFLSSIPGQLTPGKGFYTQILEHLRISDRFLVLLTPSSYERLWISFEAGAAAFADRPLVVICAKGLSKKKVSGALAHMQLLSLDEDGPTAVSVMFRVLDCPPPDDLDAFLKVACESPPLPPGSLHAGGRSFQWSPPTDGMQDGRPVEIATEIVDDLKTQLLPLGLDVAYRMPAATTGQPLAQGVHPLFVVASGIRRVIRLAELQLYVVPLSS